LKQVQLVCVDLSDLKGLKALLGHKESLAQLDLSGHKVSQGRIQLYRDL
jgi:hypothetical protein